MNPLAKLKTWERDLIASGRMDLSDPAIRRRAQRAFLWRDHGILRILWSNFEQIAPGVYRSNHPTHERLVRYANMGIQTVLNLRGANGSIPYLFEVESCTALGLEMVNIPLHARKAPPAALLLELIAIFRQINRPFVMHCKSGADRAGLASAVYLLAMEGADITAAQKMLSPRYVHFKWMTTGVLDHLLEVYADRVAQAPIPFEEWVATEYDPQRVQDGFDASRRKGRG